MTRADLVAMLDETCELCERPFRWCECVRSDVAFTGLEAEAEMLGYLLQWADLSDGRRRTAARLYASWWRAREARS